MMSTEKPVVGIIGLGRIGLPLSVTLALEGFRVIGHDINKDRMTASALAPWEAGRSGHGSLATEYEKSASRVQFADLDTTVNAAECILVAVETPHEPLYEGITPLPATRADFDYTILKTAVRDALAATHRPTEIGIISTVLPGTIQRDIGPLIAGHRLAYCPQFIPMGHVAYDLLNSEFILVGSEEHGTMVESVFAALSPRAPVLRMHIESAELTKMIYNTYISTKVAVSNLIQHLSGLTGADAAEVFSAIRLAGRRLSSSAYVGPGLGDGGPCHPRDNIALSWFVRRIGLGSDLFTTVMDVRYDHIAWLADQFVGAAGDRPLVVLGTAYKAGVSMETGSSALLLTHILRAKGIPHDVVRDPSRASGAGEVSARAYFVACPEPAFYNWPFAPGSLVFDPWYQSTQSPGIEVVWPGSPAGPGTSGASPRSDS